MVSVIIPSYNRANTIVRSIESVLAQTYRDLEVIIVDDASTDNTEEVVRNIKDNRVRYIRQPHNQGACAARNLGIKVAKGEYIAFQDSDDTWKPKKLEIQLRAMQKNHARVCFCRLNRHYDYKDESQSYLFPYMDKSCFVNHRFICLHVYISTQTIVAEREVFQKHQFDPNVKKGQDYDWAIRASRDQNLLYLNDVLVDQYIQEDSITQGGPRKTIETRYYFLEKYKDELKTFPEFHVFILNTIINQKIKLGENTTKERKQIYAIQKTPRNLLKYLLARMHILPVYYKVKEYYKNRAKQKAEI